MGNKWNVTKIVKTDDENMVVSVSAEGDYENRVSFKWDGCIDLHYNDGYIHICDVDDMIKKLQEIKQLAKENFDEENYCMYWTK